MNNIIVNKDNYEETMASIEILLRKGSKNLTQEEETQLTAMAIAVQTYEQELYGEIPPPTTPEGIAELETYRERLKQQQQGSI